MSFFTNKHVTTALLVTPVLSILSYFAVDHIVKPEAIAAQSGQSFPLVAKSNCRYESGQCTLKNGDFRLDMRPQESHTADEIKIGLDSKFNIQGLRYALIDDQGNKLSAGKNENGHFTIQRSEMQKTKNIQIAIRSEDVLYFVETQLSFLEKTI